MLRAARCFGLILLSACATPSATSTVRSDASIPSHLYSHPLDEVLQRTRLVLVEQGWQVERSGDQLSTNWLRVKSLEVRSEDGTVAPIATSAGQPADVVAYRVYGEKVDEAYCSIRVVRLVATSSNLYFGQKKGGHVVAFTSGGPNATAVHHGSSYAFEDSDAFINENFQQDAPSETASREDAPSGLVVSQYQRDRALELAIQDKIDPPLVVLSTPTPAPVPTPAPAVPSASPPGAMADAGVTALAPPSGSLPKALGGIWDGVFTFNGFVDGSYSGEVTISVRRDSAEVGEFCPDGGGTLSTVGSGSTASWQGELQCPAISINWEDLASPGSMAMPEPPEEAAAYLGIIRARGERRTEIQRLLRHCRQLVLLHGQPVLVKVAGAASGLR